MTRVHRRYQSALLLLLLSVCISLVAADVKRQKLMRGGATCRWKLSLSETRYIGRKIRNFFDERNLTSVIRDLSSMWLTSFLPLEMQASPMSAPYLLVVEVECMGSPSPHTTVDVALGSETPLAFIQFYSPALPPGDIRPLVVAMRMARFRLKEGGLNSADGWLAPIPRVRKPYFFVHVEALGLIAASRKTFYVKAYNSRIRGSSIFGRKTSINHLLPLKAPLAIEMLQGEAPSGVIAGFEDGTSDILIVGDADMDEIEVVRLNVLRLLMQYPVCSGTKDHTKKGRDSIRGVRQVVSMDDRLVFNTEGGVLQVLAISRATQSAQGAYFRGGKASMLLKRCVRKLAIPEAGTAENTLLVAIGDQDEQGQVFVAEKKSSGSPMAFRRLSTVAKGNVTSDGNVCKMCLVVGPVEPISCKIIAVAVDPIDRNLVPILVLVKRQYPRKEGECELVQEADEEEEEEEEEEEDNEDENKDDNEDEGEEVNGEEEEQEMYLVVVHVLSKKRWEVRAQLPTQMCPEQLHDFTLVQRKTEPWCKQEANLHHMAFHRAVSGRLFLLGHVVLLSHDMGNTFILLHSFTTNKRVEVFTSSQQGTYALLLSNSELWVGALSDHRLRRLRPGRGWLLAAAAFSYGGPEPFSVFFDSEGGLFEVVAEEVKRKDKPKKLSNSTVDLPELEVKRRKIPVGNALFNNLLYENAQNHYRKGLQICPYVSFEVVGNDIHPFTKQIAFQVKPPEVHYPLSGMPFSRAAIAAYEVATYYVLEQSLHKSLVETHVPIAKDPVHSWREELGIRGKWSRELLRGGFVRENIVVHPDQYRQRYDADISWVLSRSLPNTIYLDKKEKLSFTVDFLLTPVSDSDPMEWMGIETEQILFADMPKNDLISVDIMRVSHPVNHSVRFTVTIQETGMHRSQKEPGVDLEVVPILWHLWKSSLKCTERALASKESAMERLVSPLYTKVLVGCPPLQVLLFDWNATRASYSFRSESSYDCWSGSREGKPCFYAGSVMHIFLVVHDITQNTIIPYKGNFTFQVVGAGGSLATIKPFTVEELDKYNLQLGGQVSLIWSPGESRGDEDVPVLNGENNAVSWLCQKHSACGAMQPSFPTNPTLWLLAEVSTEDVEYSSHCKLSLRFPIHLHGLSPLTSLLPIFITLFVLFCMLFFYVLCLQRDKAIFKWSKRNAGKAATIVFSNRQESPKTKLRRLSKLPFPKLVLDEAAEVKVVATKLDWEKLQLDPGADSIFQRNSQWSTVNSNRLSHSLEEEDEDKLWLQHLYEQQRENQEHPVSKQEFQIPQIIISSPSSESIKTNSVQLDDEAEKWVKTHESLMMQKPLGARETTFKMKHESLEKATLSPSTAFTEVYRASARPAVESARKRSEASFVSSQQSEREKPRSSLKSEREKPEASPRSSQQSEREKPRSSLKSEREKPEASPRSSAEAVKEKDVAVSKSPEAAAETRKRSETTVFPTFPRKTSTVTSVVPSESTSTAMRPDESSDILSTPSMSFALPPRETVSASSVDSKSSFASKMLAKFQFSPVKERGKGKPSKELTEMLPPPASNVPAVKPRMHTQQIQVPELTDEEYLASNMQASSTHDCQL